MEVTVAATVERAESWNPGPARLPELLTINQVARLLDCSPRTVRRLVDAGRMPRPIRLGSMIRWSRKTVETWISQGCPRAKEMEVSK